MKPIIPLACVPLLVMSAPANAADPSPLVGERRISVGYADLNLAAAAGIAELDRRLENAVRQVCGTADHRDLKAQSDLRRCRSHAQASFAGPRATAIASARTAGSTVLAASDTR